MTFKLSLKPEQDGYSAAHATPFIVVKLAGGRSRVRADVVNPTSLVSVSFKMDKGDYDQFMDDFRNQIAEGSIPFLMDLALDFPLATQYKVQMMPDTLKTNQVSGLSYVVSMQVEAEQVDYFRGNHFFVGPNEIRTAVPISYATFLQVSGSLQLSGAQLNDGVHPPINLDGIYVISSFPAGNRIALGSPQLVNADWLKLASYPSSTTATFGPVSVIAVPT
jgi:hypothetical protein